MANLALVTANRINVVESLEQMTLPTAEEITAGQPVRLDTSTGKFTKANATTGAEGRIYGIATKTTVSGMPVTAIRRGVLAGYDLSGMAYDEAVYLSSTDGTLADSPGALDISVGRVIPATGVTLGTAFDKLLLVDCASNASGADGGAVTQIIITDVMNANGVVVDHSFFIADRPYIVDSISEIHAVLGNDAGAVNIQVTKDTGTAAPGAGTDLLTNNSGAGFNLKGTANTVQSASLTSVAASITLAAGDRLSIDVAGVTTNVAGVVVTVALTPA